MHWLSPLLAGPGSSSWTGEGVTRTRAPSTTTNLKVASVIDGTSTLSSKKKEHISQHKIVVRFFVSCVFLWPRQGVVCLCDGGEHILHHRRGTHPTSLGGSTKEPPKDKQA